MRFDVPVVGIATIQAMRAPARHALSIDAGRTLVLDGERTCSSAANEAASRSSAGRGGSSVAEALRLAVIGVGHLGRHHARILSTLDGVTLTAVVDTISSARREIAAAAARALTDYRELLGKSMR